MTPKEVGWLIMGANVSSKVKSTARLIFFMALGSRLLLIPIFDYSLDDAYITFRMASNIADGQGMVFNAGERVLAATTPLYALLMVPGELAGVGAPLFSKLLNSFFAAGSCTLLYLLLAERAGRPVKLAAVLCLLVSPVSAFITLTGMESALTAFLLLLSTFLFMRCRWTALGFALGAVSLARPEGFVFAVVLWVCVLVFRREGALRTAVPFAALTLAWFTFSTLYFGSVIPNCCIAKRSYFSFHPATAMSNLGSYERFFGASVPLYPIAPLLLLLGGLRALRRERHLLPLSVWLAAVMFFHIKSDIYLAHWYMHMLLPAVLLLYFTGLQSVLDYLRSKTRHTVRSGWASAAAVVMALSTLPFAGPWVDEDRDMRLLDGHMGQLGVWLRENSPSGDMVVGMEAVGRIGYESELRVLDLLGLCSPEVVPYILNGTHDQILLTNLFRLDYYVTGENLTERELPGYVKLAAFQTALVSRADPENAVMNDTTFIYGLTR